MKYDLYYKEDLLSTHDSIKEAFEAADKHDGGTLDFYEVKLVRDLNGYLLDSYSSWVTYGFDEDRLTVIYNVCRALE